MSTNGSSWSDLVANTNSTSTSYSHTGLAAGSARHYRVSAINSAGTGTASNTANATTDTQQDTSACATDGAVHDAANNPGLVADCEALLAGKDTLVGTGTLNWSADVPMVNWDGVSVGNSPTRVVMLNLGDYRLNGGIPPELGGLSNLTELYLWVNQLTGGIPTELGGLSNLIGLYLGSNRLTGEIPTELGRLSNLRELDLGSNRLTGEIPTELAGLSNLMQLSLRSNQLTGEIPTELGGLSNLMSLSLYYNRLTGGLPTELGRLSNLTNLRLENNQLTGGIPTELGRLSNLTWLRLEYNQLTGGIPTELGRLSNLRRLYLARNQLTGCIPEGLRDIAENDLGYLNLPDCGSVTGPEAPRGLTATADGQMRIDLSWSAPSDDGGASITGYKIEVSTNGSSWSDLVANTRSTSTSYTHSGLAAGTTRHYRVSAINSAGTGTASNVDNATTDSAPAATAPAAPTGLTATSNGQTRIDLSWRAPSDDGGADITGYRIEVSTNGSSWSRLVANTNSTSTSYTHSGLAAGSTRHYRVSATNSAGTGQASNTDDATTDSAPPPPSTGTCSVDLVVRPGESCTYPGRSDEFSVDSAGAGRFLFFTSGTGLVIRDSIINGVTYTFVASKQSDGNWLVEEVG